MLWCISRLFDKINKLFRIWYSVESYFLSIHLCGYFYVSILEHISPEFFMDMYRSNTVESKSFFFFRQYSCLVENVSFFYFIIDTIPSDDEVGSDKQL